MARWLTSRVLGGACAMGFVITGCGGVSERRSGGSDGTSGTSGSGGKGGVPGTGGSGADAMGGIGAGGTSGGPVCEYNGLYYSSGESFPAGDGCNTCYCEAGSVSCTLIDCPSTGGTGGTGTGGMGGTGEGCLYGGVFHPSGTTFPAADGCNTCHCDGSGIVCTLKGCLVPGTCDELRAAYGDAFARAKSCVPGAPRQCQSLAAADLECGCPEHVQEPASLNLLGQIELSYNARMCRGDVICDECPPVTSEGVCGENGLCVDVYPE